MYRIVAFIIAKGKDKLRTTENKNGTIDTNEETVLLLIEIVRTAKQGLNIIITIIREDTDSWNI